MPATYPSISALTVTPGFGLNFLKATYDDPNAAGGLPGLAVDRIEYWASETNDRNAAELVDEGLEKGLHVFSDGGARYYWARPRIVEAIDGERFHGDWFPASGSAGIEAAATAQLGDEGYIKLPGNTILQWGQVLQAVSGAHEITFPIPFPTAPRQICATASGNNILFVVGVQIYTLSLTGAALYAPCIFQNPITFEYEIELYAGTLRWMALGD